MFERFTEGARQVVVSARDEARDDLWHNYIGTEHLLLGMLRVEDGVASRVLRDLGLSLEAAREEVLRIVGRGDEPIDVDTIPFTPRAKRVIERTLRESQDLGTTYIGTEHILLSFLREHEGVGARILIQAGLDRQRAHDMVLRALADRRQGVEQRGVRVEGGDSAPVPPVSRTPASDGSEALVEELTDEVAPIAAGLESVPTHSDRPARHDELGRARLAEVLAERTRRVRGEDTQMRVRVAKDRRAKLRRDRQAARQAGCFMIHIHAPWGAGKSSLLNFYARDLRNRSADSRQGAIVKGISFMFGSRRARDPQLSQWIVVEFSAWAHQRLEPPWWWLLAAIRRSAVRELWLIDRSRWLRFLIRDGLWRLWNSRVIVLSVLIALAALAVAAASDWFGLEGQSLSALKASALSVAALLAVGSTLSMHIRGTSRALAFGSAEGAVRFLKRTHDPLGAYQRRFRWLVRSADRPLAVFIDDLDRCKPEYVVALLEGIQTLFAGEPVTYVVAADRTWLCDSFAKSYADFEASVGDAGRPLGYLFLEKTFQISMEIPPLSFESRRQYWRLLTRAVDAVDRLSIAPTVQRADDDFADARTNEEIERRLNELLPGSVNTEEILQAAVRRLNAPELQAQLEDLLRQFAPLLENNPRSMKRLINAYGIERDRLLREQRLPSPEERKQLILFTILRLRWPRFAEFLLKRSHEVERFNNLDNLPDDHPFAAVFMDPEVRALFDCSFVDVRLDRELLDRYAGRETAQSTSVGA